jgi:hypothetical protein
VRFRWWRSNVTELLFNRAKQTVRSNVGRE